MFHPFALLQTTPDPEIESKLGSYSIVKRFMDNSKLLIGVDGTSTSSSNVSHQSKSSSAGSSRGCSSSAGQEFKKPGGLKGSNSSSSSASTNGSQQQRGSFVKPGVNDSKPPYGGRRGYSSQPMKQPINSNDYRHPFSAKGSLQPRSSSPAVGSNSALPVGNSGGSGGSGVVNSGGSLASRAQFTGRSLKLPVNVSIDFFISPSSSRARRSSARCDLVSGIVFGHGLHAR